MKMYNCHPNAVIVATAVKPVDARTCRSNLGLRKPPQERICKVPDNAIMVRDEDNCIVINGIQANVKSYRILSPNKVMQVNFEDGDSVKTLVHPHDTFDVDTGIRIAMAKHCGGQYYNTRGIENMAGRLSYLKCVDKMLKKVHKEHDSSKDATVESERRKQQKKLERRRRKNQERNSHTAICESPNPHKSPKITRRHHTSDEDCE